MSMHKIQVLPISTNQLSQLCILAMPVFCFLRRALDKEITVFSG